MIRTYVDSGVLIQAFRGVPDLADRALAVLDDPDREFVTSIPVRLETVPKARYFGHTDESEFYETFLSATVADDVALDAVAEAALEEASQCGLSALDALHVAAARALGAEEWVTTERAGRSIHGAPLVRVVGIN